MHTNSECIKHGRKSAFLLCGKCGKLLFMLLFQAEFMKIKTAGMTPERMNVFPNGSAERCPYFVFTFVRSKIRKR